MYSKQGGDNEYNKQPQPHQPSCPPSYDPYVSISPLQAMAGVPPAYSAAVAAQQPYPPQNYGYPPPHPAQTIGYYQAAPAPQAAAFYAAPPPSHQALYYQQQQQQAVAVAAAAAAAAAGHHPHMHHHQQQLHQQQVGPPPSYGGGPQYPTGYCPPPAYQAPVPVQHHQPLYNHVGPIQKATYDAGARFGGKGGASMSIPPPPPGYAPNAAQIAAMKGQTVAVDKEKANFFTGGKGAGATFW